MKKFLLIFFAAVLFFNCKSDDKSNSTIERKDKTEQTKVSEEGYFDDSEYETLNVKYFLSNYLLIGEQSKLKENSISYLNILGHESYYFNDQGLITKTENITNNYSEFLYNNEGKLTTHFLKQHNPKLTYFKREYFYKNEGKLKEVIETEFNENSDVQKKELLKINSEDLNDVKLPFKRALGFGPYKVDKDKRLILTYRSDLIFCCGELMSGKNKLLYYYGLDGLIDSLIIQKVSSNKKMKFLY